MFGRNASKKPAAAKFIMDFKTSTSFSTMVMAILAGTNISSMEKVLSQNLESFSEDEMISMAQGVAVIAQVMG